MFGDTAFATTSLSESPGYDFLPVVADSLIAAEVISAKSDFVSSFVDTVNVSTSIFTAGSVLNISFVDSATGAQTFVGAVDFGVTFQALASVVDQPSSLADFAPLIAESATGLTKDSTNIQPGATVSESIQAADTTFAGFNYLRDISEFSTGNDTISSSFSINSEFQVAASGSEQVSSVPFYAVTFADLVTAQETVSSLADFVTSVNELIEARDSFSSNADFIVAVQEAVSALDSISGRLLWELIDSYQASVWAAVNDSQSASWQNIGNSQGSSWGNVNSSQSGSWENTNTSETSDWQTTTTQP